MVGGCCGVRYIRGGQYHYTPRRPFFSHLFPPPPLFVVSLYPPPVSLCLQSEGVQLLVFAAADSHGGGVEGAQRRPHPTAAFGGQAFLASPSEEGTVWHEYLFL